MFDGEKWVLVIDETGFSRICSAILEQDGYKVKTLNDIDNLGQRLNNDEFGLVITSYPFCAVFLKEINRISIPTLILSDQLNSELLKALERLNNTFCMIKPLDYQKFRLLVNDLMCDSIKFQGGFSIV